MSKGKGGGISLLPDFVLNKAVITDEEKEDILSSLKAVNAVNLSKTDTALKNSAACLENRTRIGLKWIFPPGPTRRMKLKHSIRLSPQYWEKESFLFPMPAPKVSGRRVKWSRSSFALKAVPGISTDTAGQDAISGS